MSWFKSLGFVVWLVLAQGAWAQLGMPSKYKPTSPKPSQAVAKVGGKSILAGEVDAYLWEWLGKGATTDIISYVLVTQDATKRNVAVSDAAVETAIDGEIASVKASQGGTTEQAIEWMKGQGFTRSRLFMRLKAKLLMDKILEDQFHPEDYVKVATIVVRVTSEDAAAVGAAVTRAQAAYDKLKRRMLWDDVLAGETNDKNILKTHGVLGWRQLSAFPETIRKDLSNLPLGSFTKPVQTKNGIQIFRIDGHGSEAKAQELAALKTLYMDEARQQYVRNLQTQMGAQNLVK